MIAVDTSVIVALLSEPDDHHEVARRWIVDVDEDLVLTPLAVAETDYMLSRARRPQVQQAFWHDLDTGAYTVRWWADAIFETVAVARRHPFLGLTDASLVALADRVGTDRIATFDRRHFRRTTRRNGRPFTLLPEA